MISQPTEVSQPWLLEDIDVAHLGTVKDFLEEIPTTYTLSVGDRPIVRSVRQLYELRKKKYPAELDVLKGEAYLIAHAVGVVAKNNQGRVTRLGYRAWFDGAGTTLDLLPNTTFKEYLAINGKFEADITAEGSAKIPEWAGKLAKEVINLGAGAELKVSTEAKIIGKLTLSLKSAKIQTVGYASTSATWQFDKDDHPLVGDQAVVQTILVPKGQKKISFHIQGFAELKPGLFQRPIPIQTMVIDVDLDL